MMRVGGKHIIPRGIGPWGVASRHARFTGQIARRYAPRSLQKQAWLSMTFARRWTLQTIMQRNWHRFALTVAPRIEIRLQSIGRAIASGELRRETPRLVSHLRRVRPLSLITETLIEHVVARSRRIEPEAKLSIPALSINGPVPRVVRRLASVSPDTKAMDIGSAQPSTRSANRYDLSPGRGSPVTTVAALDVDRLTEQVIKGIDRRIIAQRERLGRF